MSAALLYPGDAKAILGSMEPETFACTVTSIPFWGRRSYTDSDDEIGKDQTIAEYLQDLREVFALVREVMRPDGILFVNSGDTVAGSGGAGGDYYNAEGAYAARTRYRQGAPVLPDGYRVPRGQWCNIPAHVVEAIRRDGWLLRSAIVWNKERSRHAPKAHERRPGEQHEMIYMLTQRRASEYRYFHEREVERGDVWSFPPARGKNNGKAPYPVELPKRCILVSTEVGDAVLDPFCGIGTTMTAALDLRRTAVGIDLDPEAVDLAQRKDPRIKAVGVALVD